MKSIFIAGLIFLASPAIAHEDTVIRIGSKGGLYGLPEKYSPSALFNQFDRSESGVRLTSIELLVAGKKTRLPQCAVRLINSTRNDQVRISSSWYHDLKSLPPYLQVTYLNPGYDENSWLNSGYSLIFDLNTTKLIEISATIANPKERSTQSVPVDLRALCSEQEIRKFYAPLPLKGV